MGYLSSPSVALAQMGGADSSHFGYDKMAPLDLEQVSMKARDGVTIQEITYTSAEGGLVPAYLVVPKVGTKLAAVIWGHWLRSSAGVHLQGDPVLTFPSILPS
jgi:cephalosporin-C deacetylase-like acetyl esterase